MLEVHSHAGQGRALEPSEGTALAPGQVWLDLVHPSENETAFVERVTGFAVPSLQQLSEVEISSRLRRDGHAVYLSVPLVYRDPARKPRITPVGFLLDAHHLVTVRFEDLKAFGTCRERIARDEVAHPSAPGVFVTLLEAIVDRLADVLEEAGADLDAASEEVFGKDLDTRHERRPKVQGQRLRIMLRRAGRLRQLISKVRATLLAIGRLVPFVQEQAAGWLPDGISHRLDVVMHDVASLDEYEVHLSDKVQFLLDADLGFINIEQNDTFRVLTVVSVVGIPPTLVASIYGMNFKTMPELDWTYGYPWGLGLILISALIPLVLFRIRGWI